MLPHRMEMYGAKHSSFFGKLFINKYGKHLFSFFYYILIGFNRDIPLGTVFDWNNING